MGGARVLLAGVLIAALSAGSAEAARTVRVSVGPGGEQGNGNSGAPQPVALSDRGRVVAFHSQASNLAPVQTSSPEGELFVRDWRSGGITRIEGRQPALSSDGQLLAYRAGAGYCPRAYVHSRVSGTSALMGQAGEVEISRRARTVVVTQYGGDGRIWAIERQSGRATPIGLHPRGRTGGSVGNAVVSANGRSVAFASSRHLVRGDSGQDADVFVTDLVRRRTVRVSVGTGGAGLGDSGSPSISTDGRRVAFASSAGLSGGRANVYMRDLDRRTTRVVSVRRNGKRTKQSGSPAISGDGRWVAFSSSADDVVARDTNDRLDVFVRGPLR
jgi:Tol biopolymer transport system component